MERKVGEFDRQIVLRFDFLDTPGDEVAPGSDKIREHLKNQWLRHNRSFRLEVDMLNRLS